MNNLAKYYMSITTGPTYNYTAVLTSIGLVALHIRTIQCPQSSYLFPTSKTITDYTWNDMSERYTCWMRYISSVL